MRITVELPDELVRAATERTADRGETLGELFTRAIAHELGLRTNNNAAQRVQLPLIGSHGAATVNPSNADLEQALADEDAAIATRDERQ